MKIMHKENNKMGIFEMSHRTKKRLHLNPGLSQKELKERELAFEKQQRWERGEKSFEELMEARIERARKERETEEYHRKMIERLKRED